MMQSGGALSALQQLLKGGPWGDQAAAAAAEASSSTGQVSGGGDGEKRLNGGSAGSSDGNGVIRFTRDELLALRKPTRLMPEMAQIPHVISVEPLDPASGKPLEPEEVERQWGRMKGVGRGRGRTMAPVVGSPGVGGLGRGRMEGRPGWDREKENDGGNRWARGLQPDRVDADRRSSAFGRTHSGDDHGGHWPRERPMPKKEESLWDEPTGDGELDFGGGAGGDFIFEDVADLTAKFHEEKQAYYAAQRMKANGEAEAAASKVDEEADANNAATFGDDAVGAQEQPGTTAALEAPPEATQAQRSSSSPAAAASPPVQPAPAPQQQSFLSLAGFNNFFAQNVGGTTTGAAREQPKVSVLGPDGQPRDPSPILAPAPAPPVTSMLGAILNAAPPAPAPATNTTIAASQMQQLGGGLGLMQQQAAGIGQATLKDMMQQQAQQQQQQAQQQQQHRPLIDPMRAAHLQQQQPQQQQVHPQQPQQATSPFHAATLGAQLGAGLRPQQPPPPPPLSAWNSWYYQDPQGKVQGPFSASEMASWHSCGYFKGSLPMRNGEHSDFLPLSIHYPNLNDAFKSPPATLRLAQSPYMSPRQAAMQQQVDPMLMGAGFYGQQQQQPQQQPRSPLQQAMSQMQAGNLAALTQLQRQNQQQQQQQQQQAGFGAMWHASEQQQRVVMTSGAATAQLLFQQQQQQQQQQLLFQQQQQQQAQAQAAAAARALEESQFRARLEAEEKARMQKLLAEQEQARAEEERRLRAAREEEAERERRREEAQRIAQQAMEQQQRALEQQRQQQLLEAQKQAEQQRMLEQQRQQQQAMLEAQQQAALAEAQQQQQPPAPPAPTAPVAPWVAKKAAPPQQKGLMEIQEEEILRKQRMQQEQMAAEAEGAGAGVWRGVAAQPAKKNLMQIQQEEQTRVAEAAPRAPGAAVVPPPQPPAPGRTTSPPHHAPPPQQPAPVAREESEDPPVPRGPIETEVPIQLGKLTQRERKALQAEQAAAAQREAQRRAAQQQQPAWQPPQPGAAPTLKDIQEQEEMAKQYGQQAKPQQPANIESQLKMLLGINAAMGGAAPGGGGAAQGPGVWSRAANGAAPKKSLLEIQEEEARVRAQQAATRGVDWASRTAQNVPLQQLQAQQAARQQQQQQAAMMMRAQAAPQPQAQRPGWAAPPAQVRPPQPAAPARDPGADFWGEASGGGNNHRAARDPSPEQTQTGGAGLINDFGAAVPPDLLSWCTSELQRIAGSTNDFTGVVSFVYNLQEPAEIRQYLKVYVGAKPEVANFASEFIKRKTEREKKGGGAKAGGGKKKAKGQKVDPANFAFAAPARQGDIDYGDR